MPKLFVHAPEGVFTSDAKARVAAALTELGMQCEKLADTDKVRHGVWVFFAEHARDAVFSGGKVAEEPIIALVVYALEGGLDDASRTRLIREGTAILGEHAGLAAPVPAYVMIRDTPEANWGMYGEQVHLAALRGAD